MDVFDKLTILSGAAKYDVSCTSSGSERQNKADGIGSASKCGICHTWTGDGRCVSLLKILFTNFCAYDCQYCVNRSSNDVPRASFTPEEIAELTINFYKRNYIEGLFLSSAVLKNPDYTAELLIKTLSLLRNEYKFNGYIHVKAIPGASPFLIERLGYLADRISVNIELPSEQSLASFAPQKSKASILAPMKQIRSSIEESAHSLSIYRHAEKFAPAGQSTQIIIGATPESDRKILTLSEALYRKYSLKRVFYSAYVPVGTNPLLPVAQPPLLREHRLYQADWLLRYYGFNADELLDEKTPDFNPIIDPKSNWALAHLDQFPTEINTAPYEMLLRTPGIGIRGAQKITAARRAHILDFEDLKKLRISIKRARYFITCKGKYADGIKIRQEYLSPLLLAEKPVAQYGQVNIFDMLPKEETAKCLTAN
jgi:putative DNA modification/repair radical SAM protein